VLLRDPTTVFCMTRVLSCIQPTGEKHLGNFVGAVMRWVADQSTESFHGVVDLHALTVRRDPAVLREKTLETAMLLFAAGLDPNVATVFVQSHVPEHAQLSWIMECTIGYGELSRMTQFKDKAGKQNDDNVLAGLFTYPALMAADILLYDATEVPVGEDQRQHLELTRDAAQRFNQRYGNTFIVPKGTMPKVGARVMDLQDPTSKMSTSAASPAGTINVLDTPKELEKKVKRAMTDLDGEVRYDIENKPGISNLLSILAAATGEADPAALAGKYTQYGPLKADTAAALIEYLRPTQERFAELAADPGEVTRILKLGAQRAGAIATVTLDRAYKAIGLR
jgi:tryptophanyl-tRNA synthetase